LCRERYRWAERSFSAGQPYDAKYVSEGTIEIPIRVIVIAERFATIATVLEVIGAGRAVSVGNIEF
jgi:hypothetical protein